jgi:AcrR family transcriptional regulator
MARTMPPGRLRQLVESATTLFMEHGYARTQIADVAEAMGIGKGTIYLYVESKEALYDLVVRCAAGEHPPTAPTALPVRTPKPGATLKYVRARLADQPPLPSLEAALNRQTVADAEQELTDIVREIYRVLTRNRHIIKLMDRSAQFQPEVAALWFTQARGTLVDAVAEYLARRIRRGLFRSVPDARVAARVIVETIATWAVHRHWDPSPQQIADQTAEDTVVQFIVGGLAVATRRA